MKFSMITSCNNTEETLKDFLLLAIYTPPGSGPPKRELLDHPELARYYHYWGKKDDRAVFAEVEGQIIGACWSRCFSEENPGYGTLNPHIPELSIAVLPEFRKLGVGTVLLEQLLSCLQMAYSAVTLSVNSENPALKLYQRLGFTIVFEKKTTIVMIKRFNQKPSEQTCVQG